MFIIWALCHVSSDVLTINGNVWLHDGERYYIDVNASSTISINAISTIEEYIKISYVPFVIVKKDGVDNQILLEEQKLSFFFIIKQGATRIVLKDNVDNVLSAY